MFKRLIIWVGERLVRSFNEGSRSRTLWMTGRALSTGMLVKSEDTSKETNLCVGGTSRD
jgi:hypothetical protein